MDAILVIEALNRALGHRQVEPEQLRIYTDQSSQYRAADYRHLMRQHEIVCSMSAKGCCYHNAVVESFFCTLKLEPGLDDDHRNLISPNQLQRGLAWPVLLNRGLLQPRASHSTISYLSLIGYEQ